MDSSMRRYQMHNANFTNRNISFLSLAFVLSPGAVRVPCRAPSMKHIGGENKIADNIICSHSHFRRTSAWINTICEPRRTICLVRHVLLSISLAMSYIYMCTCTLQSLSIRHWRYMGCFGPRLLRFAKSQPQWFNTHICG